MVKTQLTGIVTEATIIDSTEQSTDEGSTSERMGYKGTLSLKVKVENKPEKKVGIPLFFSNPFGARLITRALEHQKVRYNQSESDGDGISEFRLEVLSGDLKGVDYRTNNYI